MIEELNRQFNMTLPTVLEYTEEELAKIKELCELSGPLQ
jgi:hypothetical protein